MDKYIRIMNILYYTKKENHGNEANEVIKIIKKVYNQLEAMHYLEYIRTVVTILWFGVRMSEVIEVFLEKRNREVYILVYCPKQRLYRKFNVSMKAYKEEFEHWFEDEPRMTVGIREFDRKFTTFFPFLKPAKEIGIKHKSHLLRHLHISYAHWVLGVSMEKLRETFRWVDVSEAESYVLSLDELTSLSPELETKKEIF